MPVKPNAHTFSIKGQIIEDPLVSGLTIWIRREGARFVLTVQGNFEGVTRDFAFNEHGENIGVGTEMATIPKPGWVEAVPD